MAKQYIYPEIASTLIKNPNRFWATPLLGGFIKIIILIPVGVELFFVQIAAGILTFLNSFVVLTTGKYWKPAYDLNSGVITLTVKIAYFFAGLTDTYPGFSLQSKEIHLEIPLAQKPNRLFAFPLFGGIVRFVLLIPYLIYMLVIQRAAGLGMVISSIPVFFMGEYPQSTYELLRDSIRLSQAVIMYFNGLEDIYPSFWISMNHKVVKWVLIGITIASIFSNYIFPSINSQLKKRQMQYQYMYSTPSAQNTHASY